MAPNLLSELSYHDYRLESTQESMDHFSDYVEVKGAEFGVVTTEVLENLRGVKTEVLENLRGEEQRILLSYREKSPLLDKAIRAIQEGEGGNPLYDAVKEVSAPIQSWGRYVPIVRIDESFYQARRELQDLVDVSSLKLGIKEDRILQWIFNPLVSATGVGLLFTLGMPRVAGIFGNENMTTLCLGALGVLAGGTVGWGVSLNFERGAEKVAEEVDCLVSRLEKMYEK